MIKFKKIIVLFLIIMFLNGCKVRSNIEVKETGKVKETVKIIVNPKEIDLTRKELLFSIENELKNYEAVIKYGNYKYKIIDREEEMGVEFFKTYDSICMYFQDTIFNQYKYKHIKCSEDEEYIMIENDTPCIKNCIGDDCIGSVDLSDVELALKLPVNAYENNADRMSDNTYIWKFDNNTIESKSLKFKINKKELEISKENYRLKKKNQETIIMVKIIIVIIIVAGILFFISNTLYKKYKNNKLEY